MAVSFREVSLPPLVPLTAEVPDAAIVGITGGPAPALDAVLRLAAGAAAPAGGVVEAATPALSVGPEGTIDGGDARVLTVDRTLSLQDAVTRTRSRLSLERMRRQGASILIVSHDEEILTGLCDEVWWFRDGALAARGDPREVLASYRAHTAAHLRELLPPPALEPAMRRGDGRARLLAIETLDSSGAPAAVWRNGESCAVRVAVRFEQPVADPVVGIMIRTRIGFEVYGTNTELEGLNLGPAAAGEVIRVTYSFRCDLCPQEYTLTAASHDPDGVWHDWLEDAIALTVAGSRYTAGVADLRAAVTVSR